MPLNDAHFGGPFFYIMKYEKPALSFENQIVKLKSKGLTFKDVKKAKDNLKNINYYRLSSYFIPFYKLRTKKFRKNTTFQDILEVYIFDKNLRKIVFSCIEKIEISIRSRIVHKYSMNKGSHWHLKDTPFDKYENYVLFQKSINDAIVSNKNKVKFINHYLKKYTEPEFPSNWMILELLTFGQISRLYKSLRNDNIKKSIAKEFGITELVLESWLHCFNYIRNISAHHSRLWNKELRVTPKNPKRVKYQFLINSSTIRHNSIYFSLSVLLYTLKCIDNHSIQAKELIDFIDQTSKKNRVAMGFPDNYKDEPLWI